MSKIKHFIKNISPLNNWTDMPVLLYIIKVIIIFWFVKFGAELIGEGIVIALHFALGKNPLQGEIFDYNTITLITYYGYGLMVGIIILYWKLFQKKTVSELGFTRKAGSYIIGLVAGTVLAIVSVFLIVLTGAISCNGLFGNINIRYILLMLGGFICQGAMEEVLCRGIALRLLLQRVSFLVAIGISSALFIIPHLSKMTGSSGVVIVFAILNTLMISIILSIFTIYYRSIWASCGLHSIWNFVLYNVFGMNLSGNDQMTASVFDMRSVGSNILNGGIYGIEASVVTAIVLAVTIVIMIIILNRKGGMTDGIQ